MPAPAIMAFRKFVPLNVPVRVLRLVLRNPNMRYLLIRRWPTPEWHRPQPSSGSSRELWPCAHYSLGHHELSETVSLTYTERGKYAFHRGPPA